MGVPIFYKDELIETIESNAHVRKNLIKYLELSGDTVENLENALDKWLEEKLIPKLDEFIEVI